MSKKEWAVLIFFVVLLVASFSVGVAISNDCHRIRGLL